MRFLIAFRFAIIQALSTFGRSWSLKFLICVGERFLVFTAEFVAGVEFGFEIFGRSSGKEFIPFSFELGDIFGFDIIKQSVVGGIDDGNLLEPVKAAGIAVASILPSTFDRGGSDLA